MILTRDAVRVRLLLNKVPWSKNLAYDIQSGHCMHFLKITTTRQQRLLRIENILTMILHLTIWVIFLDEADGVANGFFEAES